MCWKMLHAQDARTKERSSIAPLRMQEVRSNAAEAIDSSVAKEICGPCAPLSPSPLRVSKPASIVVIPSERSESRNLHRTYDSVLSMHSHRRGQTYGRDFSTRVLLRKPPSYLPRPANVPLRGGVACVVEMTAFASLTMLESIVHRFLSRSHSLCSMTCAASAMRRPASEHSHRDRMGLAP